MNPLFSNPSFFRIHFFETYFESFFSDSILNTIFCPIFWGDRKQILFKFFYQKCLELSISGSALPTISIFDRFKTSRLNGNRFFTSNYARKNVQNLRFLESKIHFFLFLKAADLYFSTTSLNPKSPDSEFFYLELGRNFPGERR